jgi:16S rRNA (guanine966-N2)-methyltransferase
VRIIAGRHRGKALEAPQGLAVRPTGERAREAVFDILTHGRFAERPVTQDAMVLDAFAGTGAMGLEALSRGARYATFFEKDRAARATLMHNIAHLGEAARSQILNDALAPQRANAPANLVFLDPPYDEAVAAQSLTALASVGWFAPDALLILELPARTRVELPAGFTRLEERRYGVAKFLFLRRES